MKDLLQMRQARLRYRDILIAIPDGSGKLRKKIKLPGMKKVVAPIMEVLEGAGTIIDEFLENQNSQSSYGSAKKMTTK
jgi:hypothetical protein